MIRACQTGLALILLCTFAAMAGDVLILKNGERYEGKISRVNDDVTVVTRKGKRHRFTAEEVHRIYRGDALAREYKKRRGRLVAGEFRSELGLARWCLGVGLFKQAAHHIKGASRSPDPTLLMGGLELAVKLRHPSLARLVAARGRQASPKNEAFRNAEAKLRAMEQLEDVDKNLKAVAEENQKRVKSAERKVARLARWKRQPQTRGTGKIRLSCRTCKGTGNSSGKGDADEEQPGDCEKCEGKGYREAKTTLRITFTPAEMKARISVARAKLERYESLNSELSARARAVHGLRKKLQAAIMDNSRALPAVSPAMLAPPIAGGAEALQKGLEAAEDAGDCERLVLESLRQQNLLIAVGAAVEGLKYRNTHPLFSRVDQLSDGLKRLAELQEKSSNTLDRQLQKLDDQTRELASAQWMLANYRDGYLLYQYAPCPACKGLGEIAVRKDDPPEEKKKKKKRVIEEEEPGIPCENCKGNGLTRQAVVQDREKLQVSIKRIETRMKRDQDYLAKLLKYDNGLGGMVKDLGNYLATGEGTLPTIKKTWLKFPSR